MSSQHAQQASTTAAVARSDEAEVLHILEPDEWKMTPMRYLDEKKRLTTWDEVRVGFDEEELLNEAERCILCPHPTCISGCPNNNPIPTYIGLVQEGRILEAAVADYEKNSLGACTGRVCAWENQCEGHCVLNARGEGVRIGAIERYIADYALRHKDEFDALRAKRAEERRQRGNSPYGDPAVSGYAAAVAAYGHKEVPSYEPSDPLPDNSDLTGFRVAVVGAGPAGLACADYLTRRGCAVDIFEAQKYAGGLLSDGIPDYVLPQGIVNEEVDRIERQGAHIHYGKSLGRDIQADELLKEFDAVFLAFGAVKARTAGCPGEDAKGVVTGQQFLWQARIAVSHGLDVPLPEVGNVVLIIGAGDTAMDCARTSVRLGAKDVQIVYRRTRAESPSRDIEIEHAMDEGVHFDYLVNPVEFIKDESGHVCAARLVKMQLGAPDASGRRSPEPIPGSEFEKPCDNVIMAVGYSAGGELAGHPEIVNRNGTIRTKNPGGETDIPGLFAGGDIVRGAMTVVHAVRDGRLAADAIGRYLRGAATGEVEQSQARTA